MSVCDNIDLDVKFEDSEAVSSIDVIKDGCIKDFMFPVYYLLSRVEMGRR